MKHTEAPARFENAFLLNAHYNLSAREQKILLFLVSSLKPSEQKEFHVQTIPVSTIGRLLKEDGKKWGGIYSELDKFADTITDKKISFPSAVKVGGNTMKGYVNWFQSVMPIKKDGCTYLKFRFSEDLKPFLLQLSEYVRINRVEVAQMTSGHAIHIFSILKASRDKQKAHRQHTVVSYSIEELKSVLGLKDKYPRMDGFKNRVINPAVQQINRYSTTISVKYNNLKSGRTVTGIEFLVFDKTTKTGIAKPMSKKPGGRSREQVIKSFLYSHPEIDKQMNNKHIVGDKARIAYVMKHYADKLKF